MKTISLKKILDRCEYIATFIFQNAELTFFTSSEEKVNRSPSSWNSSQLSIWADKCHLKMQEKLAIFPL